MAFPGEGKSWPVRVLRWILAAACLGIGCWLVQKAYATGSVGPQAFWLSLFALGLLVLTALLLLPETLAVAMTPINAVVDSLFFPGGKIRPPELAHYYRLIDSFRDQERWDDLEEICEQILRRHPKEPRPYRELIGLYTERPEEGRRLARLLRKARRHLAEEDLQALEAQEAPGSPEASTAETEESPPPPPAA